MDIDSSLCEITSYDIVKLIYYLNTDIILSQVVPITRGSHLERKSNNGGCYSRGSLSLGHIMNGTANVFYVVGCDALVS